MLQPHDELKCLRSLFGWKFGVGTPAPRAGKGHQTLQLLASDTVRFLLCEQHPNYDKLSKFRTCADHRGVDFSFERASAKLTIRLRFCEKPASDPTVRPLVTLANFGDEEGSDAMEQLVSVGDLLVNRSNGQQRVLRVLDVDVLGRTVLVRESATALVAMISMEQANALAMAGIE